MHKAFSELEHVVKASNDMELAYRVEVMQGDATDFLNYNGETNFQQMMRDEVLLLK